MIGGRLLHSLIPKCPGATKTPTLGAHSALSLRQGRACAHACFCKQIFYNESMKMTTLNARIPVGLKKAVDKYCEDRGLKVQAFVEDLIQERLEDELDLKLIEERRSEPTLSLDQVISTLNEDSRRRS